MPADTTLNFTCTTLNRVLKFLVRMAWWWSNGRNFLPRTKS